MTPARFPTIRCDPAGLDETQVVYHARRKPCRVRGGFTLLELVVVISLVAVLAAFFLDRALDNLEVAERVAMENQVRAISAGLNLQLAGLIAKGREREIARLARENPMDWLATRPENYLGEMDTEPAGEAAAGHWYFDRGSFELVYLVRRGERFVPDPAGRKRVRFQVRLVHDHRDSPAKEPVGAVFQPVVPYRWS